MERSDLLGSPRGAQRFTWPAAWSAAIYAACFPDSISARAHSDPAPGAPVSDPAGMERLSATRRIGDRRSAVERIGGSVEMRPVVTCPSFPVFRFSRFNISSPGFAAGRVARSAIRGPDGPARPVEATCARRMGFCHVFNPSRLGQSDPGNPVRPSRLQQRGSGNLERVARPVGEPLIILPAPPRPNRTPPVTPQTPSCSAGMTLTGWPASSRSSRKPLAGWKFPPGSARKPDAKWKMPPGPSRQPQTGW